jgi:hypothetical protein
MHLFVGDSSYEIQTAKYLDTRDIFIRQKSDENAESFLMYHGTLAKRLNLIPTDQKKWVKLRYAHFGHLLMFLAVQYYQQIRWLK